MEDSTQHNNLKETSRTSAFQDYNTAPEYYYYDAQRVASNARPRDWKGANIGLWAKGYIGHILQIFRTI